MSRISQLCAVLRTLFFVVRPGNAHAEGARRHCQCSSGFCFGTAGAARMRSHVADTGDGIAELLSMDNSDMAAGGAGFTFAAAFATAFPSLPPGRRHQAWPLLAMLLVTKNRLPHHHLARVGTSFHRSLEHSWSGTYGLFGWGVGQGLAND